MRHAANSGEADHACVKADLRARSPFRSSNLMMRQAVVIVSCLTLPEGNMSTPLVTALRESCEYLGDGGYHQTAQLMTVAADEIERLNNQVKALEAASQSTSGPSRPVGAPRRIARATRPAAPFAGR